jgi:hypothetical protein
MALRLCAGRGLACHGGLGGGDAGATLAAEREGLAQAGLQVGGDAVVPVAVRAFQDRVVEEAGAAQPCSRLVDAGAGGHDRGRLLARARERSLESEGRLLGGRQARHDQEQRGPQGAPGQKAHRSSRRQRDTPAQAAQDGRPGES